MDSDAVVPVVQRHGDGPDSAENCLEARMCRVMPVVVKRQVPMGQTVQKTV